MNEQRFRLVGTVISATSILLLLSFAAASGIGQQAATATQASVPDLVFQGVVIGSQNQTYIQVPFKVPDGTERSAVQKKTSSSLRSKTYFIVIVAPRR